LQLISQEIFKISSSIMDLFMRKLCTQTKFPFFFCLDLSPRYKLVLFCIVL